jgi:AraC-like DNA-binding protein
VLTADFLTTPFHYPVPALRIRLVAGFEATLATAADTTARVRALLAARILCGRPTLAGVARARALSVRALQRELAREGTSYRARVEDVRKATACGDLRDTACSADEVALPVAFEDPASCYRSFRGWNGLSPARFRHGLRAMATPTVDSPAGRPRRRA